MTNNISSNVNPRENLTDLGGGYTLLQDQSAFRFGTDSVLLSKFARANSGDRVIDLGAGNGAVTVMLCQNHDALNVTAIEIQPEACDLVRRNIARNGLDETVNILEADLRKLEDVMPARCADLIVCNPPYKPVGTGEPSAGQCALIARHEIMCTLQDAVQSAARLLKVGGRLCMVHKPERLAALMAEMKTFDIEPKRLALAAGNASIPPSIVLVEGRFKGRPGLIIEPLIDLSRGYTQ